MGNYVTVTASTFGGPGDPGTGSTGYRGDNLNAFPDSFAELSNNPGAGTGADFSALGGLPHGQTITVRNPANGKIMVLHKRDVGAGGAGIGGTKRAVDLWWQAANQLGIHGLGQLQVAIGAHSPRVFGGAGGKVVLPNSGRPGGPPSGTDTQSSHSTTTTGGTPDWNAIGLSALMQGANKRIDTQHVFGSGGFKADDPASRMASMAASGAFNLPTVITNTNNTTVTKGPGVHQAAGGGPGRGSGPDVNPLPAGWNLGRTDQGVDASARPGTPIRAINDSRVVSIDHSWYAGQPLVLMQLTAGPNKGKYWYVSEQINHGLHVGSFIPRNQTVATFAPSGTGIEIGWGYPGGGSTLAQHQGNLPPGHANTPAGIDFRHRILHA